MTKTAQNNFSLLVKGTVSFLAFASAVAIGPNAMAQFCPSAPPPHTCPPTTPAPTGGSSSGGGGGSVGVNVDPVKVINAVGGIFKKKKKPVDAAVHVDPKPKTPTDTGIVFQAGTGSNAPKPKLTISAPKPRVAVKPAPKPRIAAKPSRVVPVAPKTPRPIIRAAKVVAPAAIVVAPIVAAPIVAAVPEPAAPEPAALAREAPIITEQPAAKIVTAPVEPEKKSFPAWIYALGALLAAGAAATVMRMRSKSVNQPQATVNVECAIQFGGSRITAQSSPFVTAA